MTRKQTIPNIEVLRRSYNTPHYFRHPEMLGGYFLNQPTIFHLGNNKEIVSWHYVVDGHDIETDLVEIPEGRFPQDSSIRKPICDQKMMLGRIIGHGIDYDLISIGGELHLSLNEEEPRVIQPHSFPIKVPADTPLEVRAIKSSANLLIRHPRISRA